MASPNNNALSSTGATGGYSNRSSDLTAQTSTRRVAVQNGSSQISRYVNEPCDDHRVLSCAVGPNAAALEALRLQDKENRERERERLLNQKI